MPPVDASRTRILSACSTLLTRHRAEHGPPHWLPQQERWEWEMPCLERSESKRTGADLRNHASGAPSNADGNSHHSYRSARRPLRQRWFFVAWQAHRYYARSCNGSPADRLGDPDGSLISPRISEGHRRPQEGRSLAIGLRGVIGSGLTRHYMTGAHDRAARRVRTGAKSQAPIRSMAAVPSISLPA
jgi:hypothetical protein